MYTGEVHNFLPNGTGRKAYADGSVYFGHWWNGMRDGHGRLSYPNVDVLECEFNYDKPCGQVGMQASDRPASTAHDRDSSCTTLTAFCGLYVFLWQGTLTWSNGRSLTGIFTETGLPQDCTMTATAIWSVSQSRTDTGS